MKNKSTEKFVRNLLLEAQKNTVDEGIFGATSRAIKGMFAPKEPKGNEPAQLPAGGSSEPVPRVLGSAYRGDRDNIPMFSQGTGEQIDYQQQVFETQTKDLNDKFFGFLEQNGLSLDDFKDINTNIKIIKNEEQKQYTINIALTIFEDPIFYWNDDETQVAKKNNLIQALSNLSDWIQKQNREGSPVDVKFDANTLSEFFQLVNKKRQRQKEIKQGIEMLKNLSTPLGIEVSVETKEIPLGRNNPVQIKVPLINITKANEYSTDGYRDVIDAKKIIYRLLFGDYSKSESLILAEQYGGITQERLDRIISSYLNTISNKNTSTDVYYQQKQQLMDILKNSDEFNKIGIDVRLLANDRLRKNTVILKVRENQAAKLLNNEEDLEIKKSLVGRIKKLSQFYQTQKKSLIPFYFQTPEVAGKLENYINNIVPKNLLESYRVYRLKKLAGILKD